DRKPLKADMLILDPPKKIMFIPTSGMAKIKDPVNEPLRVQEKTTNSPKTSLTKLSLKLSNVCYPLGKANVGFTLAKESAKKESKVVNQAKPQLNSQKQTANHQHVHVKPIGHVDFALTKEDIKIVNQAKLQMISEKKSVSNHLQAVAKRDS